MFVPLVTILIINLMAFVKDLVSYYKGENFDGLFLNTLIVCFGVVNCLPIITIISTFLAVCLYIICLFLWDIRNMSSEPKLYKILTKILKRYIKFYISQNGKIAETTAIYSTRNSKIAATAAILQNVIFF